MAKRYDVMAPRPGREEGKTFWHRVGTAFVDLPQQDGDRLKVGIVFDSLPIPDGNGKIGVQLFEPREGQRELPAGIRPPGGNAPRAAGPARKAMTDDEIPF